MVQMVETKAEFDAIVAGDKLVVVDFTATWCGPCQMIGPKFAAMADEFPDVQFVKVDVDENDETAAACGIEAMPTFHYPLRWPLLFHRSRDVPPSPHNVRLR